MNYELAKKLKEMGFPQKVSSHEWYSPDGELFINPIVVVVNDWAVVPTLSELIEACGDSIVIHGPNTWDVNEYYYQHQDVWTAYFQSIDQPRELAKSEGSTIMEAVAKLWLSLSKKINALHQ